MAQKERETKGEKGVISFARSIFKNGLGLPADVVDDLMKQISSKGATSQMKAHVRALSGRTHKRFNQALDAAEEDNASKKEAGEEVDNEEPKKEAKVEKKPEKKVEKEPKQKEEMKESFMHFLLKELADEEMDKKEDKGSQLTNVDGMKLTKQEADRYMTMSDSQKEQFKKSKMQRTERMRKEEIRTEEKPEVKNLMRQKERMLKRLEDLNAQIKAAKGAE